MHLQFILGSILVATTAFGAVSTDRESIAVSKIEQTGDFMPPTTRVNPESRITFHALSSGCTQSKDFTLVIRHERTGEFVTIVRTRPDNCRRVGRIESFELTTNDLAHSTKYFDAAGKERTSNPIYLLNPIDVDDRTTH